MYSADVAQQEYEYCLRAKSSKLKIDNDYELKEYVEIIDIKGLEKKIKYLPFLTHTKRIKGKLKGMSPVQYRVHSQPSQKMSNFLGSVQNY